MCLTQGSLKQEQVCDALRCSGLCACARYTDAFNEFMTLPGGPSRDWRSLSMRLLQRLMRNQRLWVPGGVWSKSLGSGWSMIVRHRN